MRQSRVLTHRHGVTLLELIVVLALLGLVLALVAPSFLVPDIGRRNGLADAIATARRSAVLRAESITLTVDEAGRWEARGNAFPETPAIAAGTIATPIGRLRVHLTPLGGCVLELAAGTTMSWDAVRCRPADSTRDSGASR